MVNSDRSPIGFDRYFEDLDRLSNLTQPNYPPYNVVKVDDEHFTVELAIYWFGKKDISVTKEKNLLIIEGKVEDIRKNSFTKVYI